MILQVYFRFALVSLTPFTNLNQKLPMTTRRAPPPLVNGLSPKEGIPGTVVTIRGENLGFNAKDLVGLLIAGTDCLLSAKWQSPQKIVARCGLAKIGTGEVIVTTASGGRGTCLVNFRVFTIQIGPLQESAVWFDETRTLPLRQLGPTTTATSYVDDNPLGISNERDDRRIAESYLPELYPDSSGNLKMENFVPAWYLLENHVGASFNDLKSALDFMRKHSSKLQHGPRDTVKRSLGCYMSCLDALLALDGTIREEKLKSKMCKPVTEDLQDSLKRIIGKTDSVFADILNRKENADAMRNALSILQRFKLLFYLPQSIENNLQKSEYGIVLSDYSRVKALFGDTEIPLFKEAFAEVDAQMSSFKTVLKTKLVAMPSSLEEQKKIIRYLLALEPDSDPAWECLSSHFAWLKDVLWDTQQKYHRLSQHQTSSGDDSDNEEHMISETPQRFNFVDSICGSFVNKVLPFWKLAVAYSTGALSSRPNLHKNEEIEQMLISIFRLGCWLVLNAILPEAVPAEGLHLHKGKFVKWPASSSSKDDTINMIQSLRTIRNCVISLQQQEFTPTQLQPLHDTCVTVRLRCLKRLIQTTTEGIVELHVKETWKDHSSTADYAKTQLPYLAEALIHEILPLLKQVVSKDYAGELDLFSVEKLKNSLQQCFEALICAFRETLDRLLQAARHGSSTSAPQRPSTLPISADVRGKSGGLKDSRQKEKRVLMILCNCDYFERYSLPGLVARLKQIGVAHTEAIANHCVEVYAQLHATAMKVYTTLKVSAYIERIRQVKYSDVKASSAASHPAVKVSNYIKDLILCVVSVRAEIFLIAPHLLQAIIPRIIHECVAKLTDRIKAIGSLSPSAQTHLVLDLSAFHYSVEGYMPAEDKRLIDIARSSCHATDQRHVNDGLEQYKKTMRLALLSLQTSVSNGTSEEKD